MKSQNDKLKILTCLLLTRCFLGDYKTEGEKRDERKEKIVFLWSLGTLISKNDPCDRAYYGDTGSYSEIVRTVGITVNYCAPVLSVNFDLYNTSNQQIISKIVSAGTELQCRTALVNGVLFEEIRYSWYKKESSASNTVRLVFTHTIQKNSSGTAIGVDNFTNYNKGDILYCCRKYSDNSGMCSSKVTVN
ncbi:MAG TPA: hypothetical protein PL163_25600 [Leptospiraceae bacterium]|nr:hypothetical protein [Leptospiraceae bacterium]